MKSIKYLLLCMLLVAMASSTAHAAIGWAGQIWPTSGQTRLPNQDIGVYVQVWKPGCTEAGGPCADVEAWLYYKRASDGAYTQAPMTFNTQIGDNDEWTANIPSVALNGGEDELFYVEIRDISDDTWFTGIQDQAGNNPPFTLHIQNGTSQDVAVTFRVDMNCVNPALFAGGVFYTGDFLGWSTCNPNGAMADGDNDGIWEGTFIFPGGSNTAVQYKFQRNDGTNCNWECGGNREFTIDDSSPTQTLDLQVYCCEVWGPGEISGAGSYCVSLCCCSNELWIRLNTTIANPVISGFDWVNGCVDCGPECTPGSGDITYDVRLGGDGSWYLVLCLASTGREIPPTEDVYAGCFCITIDAILPVAFGGFDAVAGNGNVQLNWNTDSETGVDHFELNRDGNLIANVDAQNSASGANYSYTDASLVNGRSYTYSLVSVDVSGARQALATLSATPSASGVINEYALRQNYPNPFNPETNISYTLADVATVSLKVFTVTGEEVATLVNETQSAGSFTVSFNAAALPSGLYFYRLDAGNFTSTRKMLLLK